MAFVTRNRIITTSLAAASLLFAAACAKVGTLPEAVPAQALSYEVIQDKPDTKADYSTSVPFVSYAWFLPSGKRWDSDKAGAKPYIEGATISYNSGRWLDPTTTYYWPKQGSLTFRAYSPVMPAGTNISVSAAKGVVLQEWKLNAQTNQGIDFMVAEIAKDRKANAVSYGYLGVPTLFKHQLAKISVRASLAKSFTPGSGKFIKIHKLTLRNIYTTATFSESEDNWSSRKEVEDIVIYENAAGLELTINAQTLVDGLLLIPQHLYDMDDTGQETPSPRDKPALTLEYSVDGDSAPHSDDYFFVDNIGSHIWNKGQHIRYGIVFGTEDVPIDFNAGVEKWTDENSNDVNIGQD